MSTDRLALIEVAVESKMKADAGRLVAALTDLQGRNASVLASIGFESGQIILKGTSEAVLDQTIGVLLQDYGIDLNIGTVQVAYRETITCRVAKENTHTMQIGGTGQSVRVQLIIEPVERGAGSSFTSDIAGGALPEEYIAGVEKGIDRVHHRRFAGPPWPNHRPDDQRQDSHDHCNGSFSKLVRLQKSAPIILTRPCNIRNAFFALSTSVAISWWTATAGGRRSAPSLVL